jgi:hypothetical protein
MLWQLLGEQIELDTQMMVLLERLVPKLDENDPSHVLGGEEQMLQQHFGSMQRRLDRLRDLHTRYAEQFVTER